MLARPRPLPAAEACRPATAVIIPARNEALTLPRLLPTVAAQLRSGDELIVVDDHSTDATAAVARALGAQVITPPEFDRAVWLGKPHACSVGAAASSAPLLVFLDADVVAPADLLDRLADVLANHADSVVSVQPWHHTELWYEQASLLGNIVSLMGTGAFTPVGPRVGSIMAFGPVLAVQRSTYIETGGHAHPSVRHTRVEDIALARAVGRAAMFTGRSSVQFRMYPGGFREMLNGWTRNMSAGLSATPWWAALAVGAWVWSVAGGWLTWPWAYPLTAVQLWVLGRRAGSFRWLTAALFPLAVTVFVATVVRSVYHRLAGRSVGWKGRALHDR
jgi:4,4'-diaponeurosporenoate glycosyltransferase